MSGAVKEHPQSSGQDPPSPDQRKPVVPNGLNIPDEHSATRRMKLPVADLAPVASTGRLAATPAKSLPSARPDSGHASDQVFRGDATSYNLPGSKTASGVPFDPTAMSAAMFPGRVPLGSKVVVTLQSDPTRSLVVTINDTGPFLRGPDGRAVRPYQPDPLVAIDLTPAAMEALTGTGVNRVAVTVTIVP
jgi:rare lipoprotein A (peptidoglycan hydrolase)